jgi:hypothetical protein
MIERLGGERKEGSVMIPQSARSAKRAVTPVGGHADIGEAGVLREAYSMVT